ncbi:DUF6223 family protein [Nocardiopsis mangrovi]|uniref:DUF6223 family protein n=1 Tax=Nocardiopsis mangrovi TaxID=1179818 RepID=A0ABV9DTU3_9ACTN
MAGLIALCSVVAGGLALARSTGRAGIGGAVVAATVGLAGTALGGLALARSRHTR